MVGVMRKVLAPLYRDVMCLDTETLFADGLFTNIQVYADLNICILLRNFTVNTSALNQNNIWSTRYATRLADLLNFSNAMMQKLNPVDLMIYNQISV